MVWRNKKTDDMKIINIDDRSKQCEGGEWKLNRTTLEFRTADGFKLFHLQMKGSGKKYNSGYHGMMFHIYHVINHETRSHTICRRHSLQRRSICTRLSRSTKGCSIGNPNAKVVSVNAKF